LDELRLAHFWQSRVIPLKLHPTWFDQNNATCVAAALVPAVVMLSKVVFLVKTTKKKQNQCCTIQCDHTASKNQIRMLLAVHLLEYLLLHQPRKMQVYKVPTAAPAKKNASLQCQECRKMEVFTRTWHMDQLCVGRACTIKRALLLP